MSKPHYVVTGDRSWRAGRGFRRALLLSGVALMVAPAAAQAQQQLILNGGFESVSGTTPNNWTLSTSSGFFFLGAFSSNPNPGFNPDPGFTIPISGTRSLLFTQDGSSTGFAFQQVTLPSFLSTARLSFSYFVNLQGVTSTDQARADIVAPANVSNSSSSLLNLINFTNHTAVTSGQVSVNLASFAGQTIDLRFFVDAVSAPAWLEIDNVSLLVNSLLAPLLPPGAPINPTKVAVAIDSFTNAGGTLPVGFVNLFNLTPQQLSLALTQASGEVATGSQQTTFNAMGQFMGLLTDPFMQRNGTSNPTPGATGYADEASAYAANKKTDAFAMFTKAPPAAPFEARWSVWAAGYGGSQSTDGNPAVGSNNTTSSIAGTAVGADYLFSPNTIAGFALAGGGTNFSVANNLGSGRSDLFQAGAYVRHWNGPAYVSAALAYGWQDITTNRTVTIAGFDQLRAEFNANAFSGRLEGGYRFVTPWTGGIGITPYAAAQFVTFDLPAYAEQAVVGTNTFALVNGARDVTDTRSELGIRTDKSFAQADGILTLRGRVAWAHDFNPDRNIGATFQTLPGASFVVNGAAQASDSALVTASVEKKWRNGWSTAATFEGEFSNVTRSYAGKGVVRYSF